MKVISKYFKVALCFLAFAVLSFVFAINPTISAYASLSYASEAVKTTINAIKFPSIVDVSAQDEFLIPQLSYDEYSVHVYDPAGQLHVGEVTTDGTTKAISNTDYFELTSAGKIKVKTLLNNTYKVLYKVNGVYSNVYYVQVKNVSYELSFTDSNNLKTLVSPVVGVSNEWVKLPTAKVIEAGDETETAIDVPVTIKTTFDGAPEAVVTYDTKDAATADINAKAETENAVRYFSITSGDDMGYYVIPTEEGEFKVTYAYESSNRPTETIKIKVDADYSKPTSTVATPSFDTSFEVGDTDIELPRPTVSNKYSDNVDYNVTKVVVKITNNGSVVNTLTLTNNDLTFNADLSENWSDKSGYDKLVGIYSYEYTIEDAFGNPPIIKEYGADSTKVVSISSTPSVYMAYNYEVSLDKTVDASSVDTSYDVDLKSEYTYSNLVVPAAYAEDKITEYKDLYIVRTLVDTSTLRTYYIDNVKYSNGEIVPVTSGDYKNYNPEVTAEGYTPDVSKAVAFKFAEEESEQASFEGKTFRLEYKAYSKTLKSRTGTFTSSTFEIVSTQNESTPEIKISNLSSVESVKQNEEVTVKVTASDKVDNKLATRVFVVDELTNAEDISSLSTAITNAVKSALNDENYVYGKSNILDDENFISAVQATETTDTRKPYETFAQTTLDSANVFKFNATKNSTVIAVAINDNGTIAVTTKTVKIKNTTEEDLPSYGVVSFGSFENEGDGLIHDITATTEDTVTLPLIRFTDSTDSSLTTSVVYYIDSPETNVGVQYYAPLNSVSGNTVGGGTIKCDKAGKYTVIYSAMDDAGNISVVSFSFLVEEVRDPEIYVDFGEAEYVDGQVNAKSGDIVKIDTYEKYYGYETSIQILNGDKTMNYVSLGDGKYQFFGVGTYTVVISADTGTEVIKHDPIKIEVSPTELEWVTSFDSMPEYAAKDAPVFLPIATTNDGSKVNVKVTYNSKTGKEIDVTYTNEGWTFTPTEEGAYYVTYTAENENYVLNTSDTQFKINVGDNVAPKLTVTEKAKLSKELVFDGKNIEYKVSIDTTNNKLVVTIINNGKETVIDTGLSVTDKNDLGELDNNTAKLWRTVDVELVNESIVESGETNQWFITGTGEVVLKITAQDSNYNVGEYVVSFNVVRKTEDSKKNENVTGIVLIVISLVVLAGVIAYFAFAGKKGGSSKSRKNKVNVENESNEIVEEKVSEVEKEEVVEETAETENAEVEETKSEAIDSENNSEDAE